MILIVQFTKRRQASSFTVPKNEGIAALRIAQSTKPEHLRKKAKRKLQKVEMRIRASKRIKITLQEIANACHDHGPLSECLILKALEQER